MSRVGEAAREGASEASGPEVPEGGSAGWQGGR